jgi:hypothetical protein
MIVTTQKPLDEVLGFIAPYTNVLIAGCDGCTQPPRGLREAKTLSQLLELAGKLKNKGFNFTATTVAKQCDNYLSASILKPQTDNVETVLSLACGIGVQTLAVVFPGIPIFPAHNTHFMGAEEREAGILEERCAGCGDCLLAVTGGICPVARCSKGLLSGACGGSKEGKCELSSDRDCAWCLIYEQLKKQNKLHLLKESRPPLDYQLSGWRVTT